MNPFYPFIYNPKEKKKEKFEPEPLYIELIPTQPEKKDTPKDDERPGVVIIEIL